MDYNDGNSTTYSYLPDGTLLSREYGLKYTGRKGESNGAVGIASGADGVTTDVPSLSNSQIAERPSLIVFGKTEYSGNIIYKNGEVDKVLFPGGYCTFNKDTSEPIFHYYTQDHLGNNRTVTNEDGTVEQITHYYPFGGTFNDAGLNELGINAEHIVFLHRKSRLPAFRISLIQGVHHYHWRTLWYQAEYFFTGCQHIP